MFEAIASGSKTAEFRLDDRGFKVGDELLLVQHPHFSATADAPNIRVRVTHIVRGPAFGIPDQYAMLSFERIYHESGIT